MVEQIKLIRHGKEGDSEQEESNRTGNVIEVLPLP
jgi:hypothetical protein